MFSRSRVPICPAARYINVTDVLCPHCSLHVQQEPCAYLPDSKIIYLQMLYPRCFLHIHQELWAYLSDNKMIYLQMCYILAVSCWPGAACLFAQQQEPVLVRAAQVQEGAELSALRLLGRRGQMRHLRPFQVNHVFFLVRSYHAQATQHITIKCSHRAKFWPRVRLHTHQALATCRPCSDIHRPNSDRHTAQARTITQTKLWPLTDQAVTTHRLSCDHTQTKLWPHFISVSITLVEIHCHSGVGSIKLKIHILTLIFIQSLSFLV